MLSLSQNAIKKVLKTVETFVSKQLKISISWFLWLFSFPKVDGVNEVIEARLDQAGYFPLTFTIKSELLKWIEIQIVTIRNIDFIMPQ